MAAASAAAIGVAALWWSQPEDTSGVVATGRQAPAGDPAGGGTVAPGTDPTAPAATTPGSVRSARPVRVEVPSLGIDAPVVSLGLDRRQRLEVPGNATDVGWWSGGPAPGTRGPAVVAGHVNYEGQAGVFQDLGKVHAGDRVKVTLDDGPAAEFVVDRVEQHPKDAFPTDSVYGPTAGSELRLITCGGDFDRSSRHYEDNIVVYASRV